MFMVFGWVWACATVKTPRKCYSAPRFRVFQAGIAPAMAAIVAANGLVTGATTGGMTGGGRTVVVRTAAGGEIAASGASAGRRRARRRRRTTSSPNPRAFRQPNGLALGPCKGF